jgi:hypothetical protein
MRFGNFVQEEGAALGGLDEPHAVLNRAGERTHSRRPAELLRVNRVHVSRVILEGRRRHAGQPMCNQAGERVRPRYRPILKSPLAITAVKGRLLMRRVSRL